MGGPCEERHHCWLFFSRKVLWRRWDLSRALKEKKALEMGGKQLGRGATHRPRKRGESDPGPETLWMWGSMECGFLRQNVPPTAPPCWKGSFLHSSHFSLEGMGWGLLLKGTELFLLSVSRRDKETWNWSDIHPPWCPHEIGVVGEHPFCAAGSHLRGALGATSPVLASETVRKEVLFLGTRVALPVSAWMLK